MPSLARLSRSNTQTGDPLPSETGQQANMKRRKSSVPSLKALSLPFRSKRKESIPATHPEQLHNNILSLPTELQLQVLQCLSFTDLCALRAVSKDLNHSITGPNSAIARYWINSKLHHVHRLYPAPSHDYWRHLESQMHRWNVARHLAEMIAYHIQYKTLLYVHRQSSSNVLSASILAALLLPGTYAGNVRDHTAQKHLRFQPVAFRIRRKMTPLLFVLSHYLSSCQQSLSESQLAYSLSGEPTAFWDGVQSPERFSCYSRDQLFSAHYCWLFLEWVFSTILTRPSYAGSIERAMKGWASTPLDPASLAQVLVHGNLTAMKRLLQQKDYSERKKWAKGFLRSLDPEQDAIGWTAAWESLDMRHGDIPNKTQATAILRGPGKGDGLWVRGAEKRLGQQGIELEENELHGNASTTMRFLIDLAGFDLFHEQPPEDLEEDEDSDTEDVGEQADDEAGISLTEEDREVMDEILELDNGGGNYWDV